VVEASRRALILPALANPRRTKYDPITLERGVTHDTEVREWAQPVWNYDPAGAECRCDVSARTYLEVHNEAGQLLLSYKLYRCWFGVPRRGPTWTPMRTPWRSHIKLDNEGCGNRTTTYGANPSDFTDPAFASALNERNEVERGAGALRLWTAVFETPTRGSLCASCCAVKPLPRSDPPRRKLGLPEFARRTVGAELGVYSHLPGVCVHGRVQSEQARTRERQRTARPPTRTMRRAGTSCDFACRMADDLRVARGVQSV